MDVTLGEKVWFDHMRMLMPEYVRIVGRVVGEVLITDIGKKVFYNRVMDIPATEANRSKDLLDAISKKWVDIVQGKEYLKSLVTNNYESHRVLEPVVQQVIQPTIDIGDIKRHIDQTMQSSMGVILERLQQLQKGDKVVVDADKTLANTIAEQIISKISIERATKDDVKIDDKPEDVFVNLDEQRELKTNIDEGNLGVVTTKEDRKARSVVKKLKTIKRD